MEIIDTPEFQRLRRIRQLGFSCYTYATATHDRFSHSLGVAYVVGQLFDNLEVPEDVELLTDTGDAVRLNKRLLKLLIQLAGLLHDIGHGPFSHAFEKVAKFKHEDVSERIIKNTEGNIYKILQDIDIDIYVEKDEYDEPTKVLIKKNFSYWINQMIRGGTLEPVWIKDLISSQLDADRIDYLLRDAYMCGVKYASFDLKWLCQNIEIGDIETEWGAKQCLVVNAQKGLHAVESFVISRYHMYEQVYFHKTTRGLECLLEALFRRVKDICASEQMNADDFISEGLHCIITSAGGDMELQDFLTLDDFCIYTQIQKWKNTDKDSEGIVPLLCGAIIDRQIYKCVRSSEKEVNREEGKKVTEYFESVNKREDYFLLTDESKNVAYKSTLAELDQILVNENGKMTTLSELSPVVNSLKNREHKCVREYVHRDHSKELDCILNSKK